MKLAQAIDYYSSLSVCGWDGTKWIPDICRGAFLPFDRFITERTFGQKKRLFMTNSDIGLLECYSTIRAGDAGVYLLGARNVDIDDLSDIYNHIYLLVQAADTAEVLEVQTDVAASGTPYNKQLVVAGTYHCDVDKFSNKSASMVFDVTFSQVKITLPGDAVVSTDSEIRVNDIVYDVKDVDRSLMTIIASCVKRSGDV